MSVLKPLSLAALLAVGSPAVVLAQASPPMAQPAMSAPVSDHLAVNDPQPMTASPASQQQALAAGDNAVVTNGPVPDTAANRAKYGGPMSRTGKKTAAKGN